MKGDQGERGAVGPAGPKGDPGDAGKLFDTAMKLIDKLSETTNKTRKMALVVAVGLCLDVLLSVGFGFQQMQQHNDQVGQCQQANDARAKDKATWDYVLNALLSGPKNPAESQANYDKGVAEVLHLLHLVKVKDTPKDCTAIYKYPWQS